MKKMIIALVAMFAMTMSANAQSSNDDNMLTVERLSTYMELTSDQMLPFKTAMEQFNVSMEAYYNLEDTSKGPEVWEKIKNRHMTTMKRILDKKQYDKYVQMFELTAKNTAERMMLEATAAK